MIFILRFDCKRLILFIVIATLVSIFFIFSASASVSLLPSASDPNELTNGVYNIINSSTGMYLDVYDTKYDKEGHVYLSKKSKQNGQDFLIKRQDDGTFLIYPQSENGIYSLAYESDIMEGEFVFKTDNVSNLNKFYITQTNDDSSLYTIKPSCMGDDKLSLTVSGTKDKYNYTLAGFALDNESAEQKWQLVKVSSETLEISSGYMDVRLGGTIELYAKITPTYITGNLNWQSNNPDIAAVDQYGRVYGVSQGTAVITASCGNKTVSTTINVSPLTAYTWYSQHDMYNGGWYASALKGLYITTSAGEKKAFFINGYQAGSDWMDKGCKLCCEAMVLHNLGATMTSGYDFRTGQESNLDADPFTVGLANSGLSGKNISSRRAYLSPVYMSNEMITSRFTVEGNELVKTEYYGRSLAKIKELLDTHPEGVIVGMARGDSTHYFVFTECLNPDDPKGNYQFRVCDAAASDPSLGDNVPFTECLSYKNSGYRYSCIFTYSVYDVVK